MQIEPSRYKALVKAREEFESVGHVGRSSAEMLTAAHMYNWYLVNFEDDTGVKILGHSWREGTVLGLLVVKAEIAEQRVVVFINAESLLQGLRIFMKWWEEGTLQWRPDKFA